MVNTVKTVILSHKDILQTLKVIHVKKSAASSLEDIDEVVFMDSLIYDLLNTLDLNDDTVVVELNNETRFAIWLCLDVYRQFCEEQTPGELDNCRRLMN